MILAKKDHSIYKKAYHNQSIDATWCPKSVLKSGVLREVV